MLMPRAGEDD